MGLLAAAIAMTRPDGLIYFAAYPLLLLIRACIRRRATRERVLQGLAGYALGFLMPFGGFLLFRLLYFHDLLPNT